MKCKRCDSNYGRYIGADCAFEDGRFNTGSYKCCTVASIINIFDDQPESVIYNEGYYLGVKPIDHGDFLVVSWHSKDRDTLEFAHVLSGREISDLSIDLAERILENSPY